FSDRLLVASTDEHILGSFGGGRGGVMKGDQLPGASGGAGGRPIVNLLPLGQDERITAMLPVNEYEECVKVFMATANGTEKKTV
ncbi:DNA gyrase subunit A, partial [Escherichia coli]